MLTYEALIEEISAIEAARETLPHNVHVGALFELAIGRLTEQADALKRLKQGGRPAGHDELRMAS